MREDVAEQEQIVKNITECGNETSTENDNLFNENNRLENISRKSLKDDNRGIGVVEIVLILVVLVALVIIFKDKIMDIINTAFESITGGANSL